MKILFTDKAGSAGIAAFRRRLAALAPSAKFAARASGLEITGLTPRAAADLTPLAENFPEVRSVELAQPELTPLACAAGRPPFSSPLDFSKGPVFIAGPCAVEDEDSYLAAARALKAAGANALRAALFKPRSSPYAFQGLGWAGLKIVLKARRLTGLPLVTEATDTRQVQRLAGNCDVLQVGARNMRNYELLKELGRSGAPVLLKRAVGATLAEWLLSAEYLLSGGAGQVILCERGDSPGAGGGRGLDLKTLAAARRATGLPVLADPSHAARDRRLAETLAFSALRAGADGLLIEASPDPLSARVDGRQTVSIETFRKIAGKQCPAKRSKRA